MPNQVATYKDSPFNIIRVGAPAFIVCVDHTRTELCNRNVRTSTVQSITEDGFKTRNTYYKKVK